MEKMLKSLVAAMVALCLTIPFMAGCNKAEDKNGPVVDTIYIGHHYIPEIDPTYVDPISGQPVMAPDRIKCANAALAAVREELGVDIKWKQWSSSATQDCLQTVLAGDPFCHMAILSGSAQATVLTQNVLQPLDPYLEAFEGPDAEWILMPEVFGHYYFMERDLIYVTDWPMVFNINMIDEVPDLKDEEGNTIYPYDLYREGKWTWSVFEEYLQKIQSYYAGKKSANGNQIVPFNTNYIYAVQMALHSNGASIYDGNAIEVDAPEAVEACEYLDSLMSRGLVSCSSASNGVSAANGGTGIDGYFRNGESVFTHMARWRMGGASNVLAGRGESMGIIFWPRPDDIPFEGEEYVPGASAYEISKPACDALGLLRGFSHEESLLAVKAYVLYTEEFYKNIGRVDSIAAYRESMAPSEAITFGIDIFHPECGEDNLKVFELLGRLPANEFSENMGLLWDYGVNIFGKSVYGVDGSPKYAIAVKSKKAGLMNRIDNIAKSLESENAVDAVAPGVAQKDANVPIVFPKGTDVRTIEWAKIFTASDNVDGTYSIKQDVYEEVNEKGETVTLYGDIYIKPNPLSDNSGTKKKFDYMADKMTVDASGVDFNKTGDYVDGILVKITDSFGNTYERKFTAYVYDKDNKVPPTLKLKPERPSLAVETDTSTVNWANLYVDVATDVNGVDLKGFVKADVSYLDVTIKGTYDVVIYVEDFVGNRSEEKIQIEIK